MSDKQQRAQAKITSFFSKPVVQRTLTTGLVPDRKRKLDDTEPEEKSIAPANKKQKIDTPIIQNMKSIDDENITRNTLSGSSKSSEKISSEPNEKEHSPKLNTKPLLSKYHSCSLYAMH